MAGEREHPVTVEGYAGTLDALGTEIGRMRYDALARVLSALAAELARQADGDRRRGRPRLAASLDTLAADVTQGAAATRAVWRLCRPHAAAELAVRPEIES